MQCWGKGCQERDFPRAFWYGVRKKWGKKKGLKNTDFYPKWNRDPLPIFARVEENSILLLEKWFLPNIVPLRGKMGEFPPQNEPRGGAALRKKHQRGLGLVFFSF